MSQADDLISGLSSQLVISGNGDKSERLKKLTELMNQARESGDHDMVLHYQREISELEARVNDKPDSHNENLKEKLKEIASLIDKGDLKNARKITDEFNILIHPKKEYFFLTAYELQTPVLNDPNELLKHRFLCRGGGFIIHAETGIGKSVFALQAAIMWTLGLPFCHIQPARPLKCLVIQAEDDEGDCAEMRDGIRAYLKNACKLDSEKIDDACKNLPIYFINDLSGDDFVIELERIIKKHSGTDLVFINPLFAYIGDFKQEKVTEFLRNKINPVLRRNGCAAGMVHHVPKPARESKHNGKENDSYGMYGSSDFANWQRAGLCIKKTNQKGLFQLIATKRGNRLRWFNSETNEYQNERFISYSKEKDLIYWRDSDKEETQSMILGSSSRQKISENEMIDSPELIEKALYCLPEPMPTLLYKEKLTEKLGLPQRKINALFINLMLTKKIKQATKLKGGGPRLVSRIE